MFVYKVKFTNGLPQPTAVLTELRSITGLNDIRFISKGKRAHIIFNPLFPKPEFSIDFMADANEIVAWTTNVRINYLLEATIAALESLGGKYNYKISDLARKKWEEVKEQYKERTIVDIKNPDN